jgi:uncharacterized membrane protein
MLHDRTSSIFFLIVSVIVFIGSVQLGLGTTRQPGPGFITFGTSGLLGILSLIGIARTFVKKK